MVSVWFQSADALNKLVMVSLPIAERLELGNLKGPFQHKPLYDLPQSHLFAIRTCEFQGCPLGVLRTEQPGATGSPTRTYSQLCA